MNKSSSGLPNAYFYEIFKVFVNLGETEYLIIIKSCSPLIISIIDHFKNKFICYLSFGFPSL